MTTDMPMPAVERLRQRLGRERRARQEAEQIAEQGTRRLYERQRELELLHVIADAANAATSVETAIQMTLDQFCAYTGWPVGHAYLVANDATPPLIPSALWHLDYPERFANFRQIIEATRFRVGEGLPGRVLERRAAVWIRDVTKDADFRCARHALEIGVLGAFGFPILVGPTVVAVLEFFSRELAEPNPSRLKIASQAGIQLGRIFERTRAQSALEAEIAERTEAERKTESLNKQLIEAARQAGMAEVATSVLHNVGNVLNSVNVSSTAVMERVRNSKVANLAKLAGLVREHRQDLAAFLASDPKGKQVPDYLAALAAHLTDEQTGILEELQSLNAHIGHIKEIVAMQQNYSKVWGIRETLPIVEMVEDALRLNAAAAARNSIQVVRDYADVPPVLVEKHKLLQILVNLIRNARQALDESGHPGKRLTIRVGRNGDDAVQIAVVDNGVGISPENLTRIFGHGFTTRRDGHGFGLHSSALAARELGGSLTAHSDGPGQGATFTLELPVKRKTSERSEGGAT